MTEDSLKKSRLFAYLAMAGLGLYAVLEVIRVISHYSYATLIGRILNRENVTLAQANAADHRVHILALASLGLYLLTGIVFIMWFRDAYINVGRMGVTGLRWSSGWAVGAWFVPFLNLVRPKAITNDIWRGSDPKFPAGSTVAGWDESPPALYQVWWGMWILADILGLVAYRVFAGASTPDALRTGSHLLIVSDAVDVIAAVLALLVVRSLFSRQRERAAALAGQAPATSV